MPHYCVKKNIVEIYLIIINEMTICQFMPKNDNMPIFQYSFLILLALLSTKYYYNTVKVFNRQVTLLSFCLNKAVAGFSYSSFRDAALNQKCFHTWGMNLNGL